MKKIIVLWGILFVILITLLPSSFIPAQGIENGENYTYLPLLLNRPFATFSIVKDQAYQDISGWNIFGEVINTSNIYLKNPEFVLDLYASDKSFISTYPFSTLLTTNLPPWERICFSVPIETWTEGMSYKIRLEYFEADGQFHPELMVSNVVRATNEFDEIFVTGNIANNEATLVTDIWITGAFYAESGKVTGCAYDDNAPLELPPGEDTIFSIPFYGLLPYDAADFWIYTDGTQ